MWNFSSIDIKRVEEDKKELEKYRPGEDISRLGDPQNGVFQGKSIYQFLKPCVLASV